MADGIEFLVRINAKYDEANAASKSLDTVTASAQKTDKAVSEVDAEFQKLSKHLTALKRPGQITELRKEISALENPAPAQQVGLLGRAFAGAGAEAAGLVAGLGVFAVGGLIIGGVGALIGKVHELGVEMLLTAGEAQRTERAFNTLLGKDVAPGVLDWTDQMAGATEFTDGTIKSLALTLSRAGFKGEDLARAMSAVSDMAAMSEDKMEGAAGAAAMLSRIRLKEGGIGDRDLLRLGISPDAFYKKLATDLGMGAKQVEKELKEGKIKAEDVIEEVYNSIAAKTGKPLGGAGLEMTGTFLSQLEKTKDIIPNLFEELNKSEGLGHLSEALEHLVNNLAPGSPNGQKLIDGLDRMLNAFAHLIDEIDWDKFTDTAVRAFQVLPPLIETTTHALEGLFHVLERILSRGSIAGGVGETIGKLVGLGDKGAGVLGTITEWTDHPARKLGGILAKGLTTGLSSGLNEAQGAVYDAMGNVVGTADVGLRDAAEIHSPSRRFRRLGAMTAEGYEEGIYDKAPDIGNAFKVVFPPMEGPLLPDGYAPPAAAAGPPGGASGPTIHATIDVHIGEVTGDEKGARYVAEEAGAGVRAALQRVVEQLVAEGA